jgi:CHAD domain-containing protein
VAKAREIPGLSEEDSYAAAAARIVAVRAEELADQAEGVLDTGDIERVHDMRVATRRMRAALEVFEPCFPHKRWRATLREVKQLADALGERRDRDVAIAALESFNAAMPAPDRPGIDTLIERLRSEQDEANVALAPYVAPDRLTALGERLRELVSEARSVAPEEIEASPTPPPPQEEGGQPPSPPEREERSPTPPAALPFPRRTAPTGDGSRAA